jgi:hypothetical protein
MSLVDCAITLFGDICNKSNVEYSKIEVEAIYE